MNKNYCQGCRDNFYNNRQNGQRCFHFQGAKLIWRIAIGHWERPPYKNKQKVKIPNCWHGEGSNRIHYIDPKKLTKRGYWK